MKVFVLSHNVSRPSYRQRIGNYLPYLTAEGIVADVCQLPDNQFRRWSLFRKACDYDLTLLHKKCLNFWDAHLLRRYARTLLYDFDDAIMYSPTKPDNDRTSHLRLFKRTVRLADGIIAGNDYLAEQARRFNPEVHVLPTGLDTEAYQCDPPRKQDDIIRLVWIGSKSTINYLAGLKPVFEQLGMAYKNIVLRIIADDFPALEKMPVEKCPWSLQTQVQDLMAGDIGLAPLPDNRFTRGKCGFKILQYFAAGLPVIASPVGVNTSLIEQSGAGLLATTAEQWKQAIEKLLRDKLLRTETGQKARRYVHRYDTSVLAKEFCDILKSQAGK